MTAIPLPVPENAIIRLGGYTAYKTAEWNRFFWTNARRFSPGFYLRYRLSARFSAWKQNDCVYIALQQYLLRDFGVLLPEKTLFQVFNPGGKGILPTRLLPAIRAVVEPLGLEIEHVIVADPLLRAALGSGDVVQGIDAADALRGLPGICMINLKEGYSHAFYWKAIQPRACHDPAFRVALSLRWKSAAQAAFSPSALLESYEQLIQAYFNTHPGCALENATWSGAQLNALRAALGQDGTGPAALLPRLLSITSVVASSLPRRLGTAERHLLEAGKLLIEVFRISTMPT